MSIHVCLPGPSQVVDLLIFKGREELETYLMMHKQRHHLVGCSRLSFPSGSPLWRRIFPRLALP